MSTVEVEDGEPITGTSRAAVVAARRFHPKKEETYGLTQIQTRNLSRTPKRQRLYRAAWRKGEVDNLQQFNEKYGKIVARRPITGVHATLPKGTRQSRRVKVEAQKKVRAGGKMEDTKHFKTLQKNARRKTEKIPCPKCGRVMNRGSIKTHDKNVHDFCASVAQPLSPARRHRIAQFTNGLSSERRGRIKGSSLHHIYTMTDRANPFRLVDSLIIAPNNFKTLKNIPDVQRGIRDEPKAIEMYKSLHSERTVTYPVGFHIHPRLTFVGATPDGLTDDNGCLEMKSSKYTPDEIARGPHANRHIVLAKDGSGRLMMNRSHKNFSQVIAQINCTERRYCDYCVYYPKKVNGKVVEENGEPVMELWVERIEQPESDEEWAKREPKLIRFFYKYMAGRPVPSAN